MLGRAREAGLRCEAVISVAFGCPYEGHVAPERVFAIARRLVAAGAQEIGFGDTTGHGQPGARCARSSPRRATRWATRSS